MHTFNLFQQLRIQGWVAVTLYGFFGLFLNRLGGPDLTFFLLLVSLFLANGFAYVYNDYHDAPFDKLDPLKAKRNPFCGDDPRKLLIGRIVLVGTPLLSSLLALFVPFKCAVWVFAVLFLMYIYSSPHFRGKERPFWDWFIHIFWIVLNFVPGHLYFFGPDLLFYFLAAIVGLNSLIAQINNELNDFSVDAMSKHRTTALVLGKRNTFYVQWGLEILLFGLSAYLAFVSRYPAVFAVLVLSYLYYTWVERITALDRIEGLREFVRFRSGHLVTLWLAVWLMEAGLRELV